MEWLFSWLIVSAIGAIIWGFFSRSRWALTLVIILNLLALLYAGFWSWFFRDGMAPGFFPSSGLEAMRRFASDMIFPTSICSFTICTAVVLFWWRRRGLK